MCHAGPCGPCPLSGPRTCPCGRRGKSPLISFHLLSSSLLSSLVYYFFYHIYYFILFCYFFISAAVTLPCDQQIPSCGGTCEKVQTFSFPLLFFVFFSSSYLLIFFCISLYKTLLCGRHSCQQRCHNGPCPVCRTILVCDPFSFLFIFIFFSSCSFFFWFF